MKLTEEFRKSKTYEINGTSGIFTFRLWEKGNMHKVYFNDPEGRSLGCIDLDEDHIDQKLKSSFGGCLDLFRRDCMIGEELQGLEEFVPYETKIEAPKAQFTKYGYNAQMALEEALQPNKSGFYNIDVTNKYWDFSSMVRSGRYGLYVKFDDTFLSVNSRGCIYAKAGSKKEDAFLAMVTKLLKEMKEYGKEVEDTVTHNREENIKAMCGE